MPVWGHSSNRNANCGDQLHLLILCTRGTFEAWRVYNLGFIIKNLVIIKHSCSFNNLVEHFRPNYICQAKIKGTKFVQVIWWYDVSYMNIITKMLCQLSRPVPKQDARCPIHLMYSKLIEQPRMMENDGDFLGQRPMMITLQVICCWIK